MLEPYGTVPVIILFMFLGFAAFLSLYSQFDQYFFDNRLKYVTSRNVNHNQSFPPMKYTYEELFGNCSFTRDDAIRCAYKWCDRDGDMRISYPEVIKMRKDSLSFLEQIFSEKAQVVMYRCDIDRDGFISIDDFVHSNSTCLKNCKSTTELHQRVCTSLEKKFCEGRMTISPNYQDAMRLLGWKDDINETIARCNRRTRKRSIETYSSLLEGMAFSHRYNQSYISHIEKVPFSFWFSFFALVLSVITLMIVIFRCQKTPKNDDLKIV